MATSISFNYSQRREEILQKIRFFEREMGISIPASLSVEIFNKTASADLNRKVISVPPWLLFRSEDVPEQFRIHDINDPRLADSNFLNTVADWINGKIQEAGLSAICRPADVGSLQLFLSLIKDPEKYAQGRDFIIGHEVAHLAYAQAVGVEEMIAIGKDMLAALGIIGPLFYLVLFFGLTPLVSVGVAVTAAGIGLTISGASLAIWLTQMKRAPSLTRIEEEKKADLDAVNVLHDARGGIYYFDTLRRYQQRIHLQNTANTSIDPRGNNTNDKKHPPLTERIAYLGQWQLAHHRA